MATTSYPKNDSSQILLMLFATVGFAFVMYISGGNRLIHDSNSKRNTLRALRDMGINTKGEFLSKTTGKEYFDTQTGRFFTPTDTYIKYLVANEAIEVKSGEWESSEGDDINVRYLPSNPMISYYTSQSDISAAVNREIRSHTIRLGFVWLVILAPLALGSFVLLASIRPEAGTFNLIALILVVATFSTIYLCLVLA